MSAWGVATCGDETWIGRALDGRGRVASCRCHKLSLPVNHVPYLTTLMCIARINIYGITLTVSLARARLPECILQVGGAGLTRNCIRIKMRAA